AVETNNPKSVNTNETTSSNTEKAEAADPKSQTQKIKGVLKSFEEKKSPKGNSYGLITVLEESKETYTILSRNEEDVNILQNTAIPCGTEFSGDRETGSDVLETRKGITGSSYKPEQENADESSSG